MFIEQYLSNITLFAGSFAPTGWAYCDGSLQSVADNPALFSLLGTTYGGDGQTTFALPDLRGRYAVHAGQGRDLPNYYLGHAGGVETTTLLNTNLPVHTHQIEAISGAPAASTANGTVASPADAVPAAGIAGRYSSSANDGSLAPVSSVVTSAVAGGSQPISNLSPFLCMNYIICIEGIYPSRSN